MRIAGAAVQDFSMGAMQARQGGRVRVPRDEQTSQASHEGEVDRWSNTIHGGERPCFQTQAPRVGGPGPKFMPKPKLTAQKRRCQSPCRQRTKMIDWSSTTCGRAQRAASQCSHGACKEQPGAPGSSRQRQEEGRQAPRCRCRRRKCPVAASCARAAASSRTLCGAWWRCRERPLRPS